MSATPVDWASWPMGKRMAPFMFVAHWSAEDGAEWSSGAVVPYGPLELEPAAQVLNYGQSIFEGMKAHRSAADRLVLFRPCDNALRFQDGAVRMAMPPVPMHLFIRGVESAVSANAQYVPACGAGSLYLRPLLLGSGSLLGLCPAPSYTFVVYACPVGTRLKAGALSALDFAVESRYHRAAPRGVGGTKAAGNYSPCLLAQADARKRGHDDVLFLDARSDQYLEEGAGCNVFAVSGNTLTTPPAQGSILPGITRSSLIKLASKSLGMEVREEPLSVQDALQADEVFASGTMMVVQPIGTLTHGEEVKHYAQSASTPGVGPITHQLYTLLTDIQLERSADTYGWVHHVCVAPSTLSSNTPDATSAAVPDDTPADAPAAVQAEHATSTPGSVASSSGNLHEVDAELLITASDSAVILSADKASASSQSLAVAPSSQDDSASPSMSVSSSLLKASSASLPVSCSTSALSDLASRTGPHQTATSDSLSDGGVDSASAACVAGATANAVSEPGLASSTSAPSHQIHSHSAVTCSGSHGMMMPALLAALGGAPLAYLRGGMGWDGPTGLRSNSSPACGPMAGGKGKAAGLAALYNDPNLG